MRYPFNYVIPNGPIQCSFLRVHILEVDFYTQTSLRIGLSIIEIYGKLPDSFVAPISGSPFLLNISRLTLNNIFPNYKVACPSNYISPYYSPTTYLYIPDLLMLFVCDLNYDRLEFFFYAWKYNYFTIILNLSYLLRQSSRCYSSSDNWPNSWTGIFDIYIYTCIKHANLSYLI